MDAFEPKAETLSRAAAEQPGRRTRRRRSKRRRILRVLEPFAILAGIGLLSTGMIKVVERGVPTDAAAKDHRRLERSRANARFQVQELTASLDPDWIPVMGENELGLPAVPFARYDAPLVALERAPMRVRDDRSAADLELDQFTTSISSTSNTSAEPPGIAGDGLASP